MAVGDRRPFPLFRRVCLQSAREGCLDQYHGDSQQPVYGKFVFVKQYAMHTFFGCVVLRFSECNCVLLSALYKALRNSSVDNHTGTICSLSWSRESQQLEQVINVYAEKVSGASEAQSFRERERTGVCGSRGREGRRCGSVA